MTTVGSLTIGPPSNPYLAAFGELALLGADLAGLVAAAAARADASAPAADGQTFAGEAPLPADLHLPVARAAVVAAQSANDRYFRFHLVGAVEDDPPVVATAGHPGPVMDVNGYRSTRKLTLLHAIDDPLEVGFPTLGRSVLLPPAQCVVFASFLAVSVPAGATFLAARVHGAAYS